MIALSVVGILVIGSAKESVQTKQIAGLILGLVVMVLTPLIDYSWVLGFYWLSYFVGIGLLAAVLLAGEMWVVQHVGFVWEESCSFSLPMW
ncbi:MAG: hypothetical protein ACLR2E_04795 [Lachnospiraceae bacterium]